MTRAFVVVALPPSDRRLSDQRAAYFIRRRRSTVIPQSCDAADDVAGEGRPGRAAANRSRRAVRMNEDEATERPQGKRRFCLPFEGGTRRTWEVFQAHRAWPAPARLFLFHYLSRAIVTLVDQASPSVLTCDESWPRRPVTASGMSARLRCCRCMDVGWAIAKRCRADRAGAARI